MNMAPHVQVRSGSTYWGKMAFQKRLMRVRPGPKPDFAVRSLAVEMADSKVA